MDNNDTITVNDKPLKEYLEKVEGNEINLNYKSEVGTLSKKAHRPIITRPKSRFGNLTKYEKKDNIMETYSEKEILEKFGTLPITHDSMIKNMFEVIRIKERVLIKDISKILKKLESSVRSRISYIQQRTSDKVITKDGQYISFTDKDMDVETAFLMVKYPYCNNEDFLNKNDNEEKSIISDVSQKQKSTEMVYTTESEKSSSINVNVNVSGSVFINFGVCRRGSVI